MRTILIACALVLGAGRARADTVLEGRVVGPYGKPVASAIVLGTLERDEQQATFRIGPTAADGTFRLAGTPGPGPLRSIRVYATGLVVFRGVNDADTIELIARAPGRIDVRTRANFGYERQHMRLARGGVLQARLLDTATGAAVAGCRLTTAAGDVVTDAKGRFRITVAYGPTTVTPACADYGTDWDSRGIQIDFAEATAGQPQTVTTRRNHYVTGTVTDAAGDVLPGVKVIRTHLPKGATEPRFVKRPPLGEVTTTDGNGDFVFQGSSMDSFMLRIDDPKAWQQRFRYGDLKGRIVIQLPR